MASFFRSASVLVAVILSSSSALDPPEEVIQDPANPEAAGHPLPATNPDVGRMSADERPTGFKMAQKRVRSYSGPYQQEPEDEMCRNVCLFCRRMLSMRWAALCHVQCLVGGNAYDACATVWSLRDSLGQGSRL